MADSRKSCPIRFYRRQLFFDRCLPTAAFGSIYIVYCRWLLTGLWYEFLLEESDAKSIRMAMLRAYFSSSSALRVEVRDWPVEPGAAKLAARAGLHRGEKNEAKRAQ